MSNAFPQILMQNASQQTTITIEGASGNIHLGGNGSNGDVRLMHDKGEMTIHLDGGKGNLTMGGGGSQGDITLLNPEAKQTIHLDGGNGNLTMGGSGSQGDITLLNPEAKQTIHLDGGNGNGLFGGNGSNGDLRLTDAQGKVTVHLDGETGDLTLSGTSLKPADYVFAQDYALEPLSEVKAFISAHRHLPGLPSGQQMQEQGVGMAALTMKLLEKIEELTLHVIQQDEQLRQLQQRD
ncbi:MAG: hypothetical protein Q4G39_02995 [Brachymonas sp.]|nr:hypothetical protein [Brachymonas sp.]